jgi:inositol phosphorylceramide synthase catalytic subunit
MPLPTESTAPPETLGYWKKGVVVFVAFFIAWIHFTKGLRPDHVILMGVLIGLFWFRDSSAHFAYRALPFFLVGMIYENIGWLMPYRPEVHIADLYYADLALFGVGGQILPKVMESHTYPLLDLICGLSYMFYLISVFAVGAIFWFKRDLTRMSKLAFAFLLVNLMGIATWMAFPAAPPWYVDQYGLGPAVMDAIPSAAGAARFDQLVGMKLFGGFYERSINVFGAMPSLHVGYPTVIAASCWSLGNKWRVPSIAFAALMGFSAVYLQHHYVLDVLAGALYGVIAWGIVEGRRSNVRFLQLAEG